MDIFSLQYIKTVLKLTFCPVLYQPFLFSSHFYIPILFTNSNTQNSSVYMKLKKHAITSVNGPPPLPPPYTLKLRQ